MRQVTVAPLIRALWPGGQLSLVHMMHMHINTHALTPWSIWPIICCTKPTKFIIIYAKYPNPPVQCPTSYKLNVSSFLQVSATSTRQQRMWNIAPRQVSELLMICPKGPFNTSLRALYTHPHFKSCSPEHSKSRNKNVSPHRSCRTPHTPSIGRL